MWFEWLARRCDMGALATVSAMQPPLGKDQQGSEYIISLSPPDVASIWSMQKAQRRERALHVFPHVSPLSGPGPGVVSNELDSSPIWSPCLDNSPYRDLDYHAGPGGLRALSISLLNDANSEGEPWGSEPFNQLAKNYLMTMQELKQSRFNHGYEMPFEPERYKELKAGFWKRLAVGPFKDEQCDSTSISGAQVSNSCFESNSKPLNATTKRATLSKSQGSSTKKVGLGLNGSVEIEVVLTGKWNALEEAIMVPKPNLVVDHIQHDVGHMQNVVCEKEIQDCEQEVLLQQCEIDQPSIVEKACEDNVCRSRTSFREASDGESLEGDNATRCEDNPFRPQHQQDSSECSFSSGGGIGRGRIREDGSPTSSSSNHQMYKESKASVKNLEFNIKEEDETLWSNANWCVVDSYMTGHGKETTWTVHGFEEEDGFFQGNSLDCKDRSAFEIFATKRNHSHFSDLTPTHFLHVEAPNVETQHGPPPKWTQQALHEQVAKNLQAQQKKMSPSPNGFEMIKSLTCKQKKAVIDVEDGGKEEANCREFVHDDILHCRKGRKLLKEAVLRETREKIEVENVEASIDMNDIESTNWKSERHSLNACVVPSSYKNGQGKEVLNLVKHRERRRRKRRGAKKYVQLSAAAMACCVSMVGGTVNTLRKTKEDATTLALKLVEFQATEVKNLKAKTSAMCTHVNLLQSEVKGLEAERRFNVLIVFPWQQFFRNIMIGISLVSGTLGLHRAIKLLFQLLFGRVVQTATSMKEKTIIAVTLLCSSSYIGKEMWQIFSQVQAKKKMNEVVFQEKLRLVLERLSQMSTLTYQNGIVHQLQEEELKLMKLLDNVVADN